MRLILLQTLPEWFKFLLLSSNTASYTANILYRFVDIMFLAVLLSHHRSFSIVINNEPKPFCRSSGYFIRLELMRYQEQKKAQYDNNE
ncbi:hypothetical protein SAMN05428978_100711 [Nitrosomonas sp. Nm34]|nr:hypothetical protein SAMN05428978_100711 [Nitrosomonas sp. Nm34]